MLWKKEIHVGFCEKNYHQSEIAIKPYKEYDIFYHYLHLLLQL